MSWGSEEGKAFVYHPAQEAQSGVKQLVHSVCLSVYRCQSMIEELLHFNYVLYFEHCGTQTALLALPKTSSLARLGQ